MLIGLQNVTFEFGARAIVEDATWHIQPAERIGFIGYNGTGKSTLLKLLTGDYQPSKGTVEKGKDTSIGYFHQDLLSFETADSVVEVAMGAFERVKKLEKELEMMMLALEKSSDEKLLEKYANALHEMDMLDGYTIRHKAEEVLLGLGFTASDFTRPYSEFSGGWRMRVLLAKMILQKPDVLLMDEPTNHLDLPSIEWLEKYLVHYHGSVVIVSHDKYFLNRMVTKIVELYQQALHVYIGNYDYYEKEKEQRVMQQQRAFENQQDYIRQQERFIERFRAGTKATVAQSVIKRLEKIERIEQTEIERPNIKINFSVEQQPGKIICTLKNITKNFGEQIIINRGNAEINRGDKIALIGANGKGKSTLLRIVAGTEQFSGEREWGHNVQSSFYAQHQLESLHLNYTILEEMLHCGSQKNELELRTLLGCFLFSGDDTSKYIKVLSGGEKARVALAKVIVSRSNFMLLDEPTNHLDIYSASMLAEALQKYGGSYLLVSHDRHFISKTANKIWEIVDKTIKEFKGSYAEWVAWKETMAKKNIANNITPKVAADKPKEISKTIVATENQQQKKELQKLQKQFEKAEADIVKLRLQKNTLEAELGQPAIYDNRTLFVEKEKAYKILQRELETATIAYEALFEKMVNATDNLDA